LPSYDVPYPDAPEPTVFEEPPSLRSGVYDAPPEPEEEPLTLERPREGVYDATDQFNAATNTFLEPSLGIFDPEPGIKEVQDARDTSEMNEARAEGNRAVFELVQNPNADITQLVSPNRVIWSPELGTAFYVENSIDADKVNALNQAAKSGLHTLGQEITFGIAGNILGFIGEKDQEYKEQQAQFIGMMEGTANQVYTIKLANGKTEEIGGDQFAFLKANLALLPPDALLTPGQKQVLGWYQAHLSLG